MSDEVWESEADTGAGCLTWFAGGLGLVLLVAALGVGLICCGCAVSWTSFVRFGIGTDLDDYKRDIGRSNLSEDEKKAYIARIEAVDDRLDEGELDMTFIEWVTIDSDMQDVLDDGTVESWEIPTLEDSIRRMER